MNLFDYPSTPGWKDADTSRKAAESMVSPSKLLRERVLAELMKASATPDEIAFRIGASVLSIRPRFSELLQEGKIEDTAVRRTNTSGRQAKVYRIKGETN